jgi:hypothetical protein
MPFSLSTFIPLLIQFLHAASRLLNSPVVVVSARVVLAAETDAIEATDDNEADVSGVTRARNRKALVVFERLNITAAINAMLHKSLQAAIGIDETCVG